MLNIQETNNRISFSLRVKPSGAKNSIVGTIDNSLKISVCAAPEKGKANKEIINLLSKTFGIKKNQIEILKGEKSKNKDIAIYNCDKDIIVKKLKEILEQILKATHQLI